MIIKPYSKFLLPTATAAVLVALLLGLFRLTYLYDNKYTDDPPYGEDGVFSFSEKDLNRPLFLIDGWRLAAALCLRGGGCASGAVGCLLFGGGAAPWAWDTSQTYSTP
ncbi:MAG: hypothetical protein RRY64_09895, partial [Oscillospiraceae bacterium]